MQPPPHRHFHSVRFVRLPGAAPAVAEIAGPAVAPAPAASCCLRRTTAWGFRRAFRQMPGRPRRRRRKRIPRGTNALPDVNFSPCLLPREGYAEWCYQSGTNARWMKQNLTHINYRPLPELRGNLTEGSLGPRLRGDDEPSGSRGRRPSGALPSGKAPWRETRVTQAPSFPRRRETGVTQALSFPRRREPSVFARMRRWVPAFAGTTKLRALHRHTKHRHTKLRRAGLRRSRGGGNPASL